jgi:FMNH2-dependent dimethyl sulfone monooxygenase
VRYGFWTPVFGGWLRNVPDEGMAPTFDYVSKLCRRAEQIGYDLTLVAELNLNDIKGTDQPALDAWSTAAALAAVTEKLELMVAVRPNFHHPALFAKQAANIDNIAGGRLALNVVSSWWAEEATSYGLQFDQHDDRYGRTTEWLSVVDGLWSQTPFNHDGERYKLVNAICEPKPVKKPRPVVYAGGESEAAKTMIANSCDAYVMHGDDPAHVAEKIALPPPNSAERLAMNAATASRWSALATRAGSSSST